MGRIGTGKSTAAEKLAEALGWEVLSSDRLRKKMAGVEPYVRGSELERRDLYSAARSNRTYEALTSEALGQLESKEGVVLDATYSSYEHRDSLRNAFHDENHGYCFIEMTASDETIQERLRVRDGKQRSISDARLEDFDALSNRYDAPDDLEDAMHIRVSTEGPLESTVTTALTHVIRMDLGR
jgi:predicted kinase